MSRLTDFLPGDARQVLDLEPEELAGCVLSYFASLPQGEREPQMNRYSFGLSHTVSDYPPETHDALSRALMAAWMCLEHDNLVAPRPGAGGPGSEWYFLTPRGEWLAREKAYPDFKAAQRLPEGLLHRVIESRVRSEFLRRDYDTAVFKAFREVEIAVRKAAGYADEVIGVPLMRKAFDVADGPLTDRGAIPAERQATSDLFAGAVGSFKNPGSHRHVGIDQSATAVELIALASHLLRIIDERGRAKEAGAEP